jgi:hypothetical protein
MDIRKLGENDERILARLRTIFGAAFEREATLSKEFQGEWVFYLFP